jgi:hypothetical protein
MIGTDANLPPKSQVRHQAKLWEHVNKLSQWLAGSTQGSFEGSAQGTLGGSAQDSLERRDGGEQQIEG